MIFTVVLKSHVVPNFFINKYVHIINMFVRKKHIKGRTYYYLVKSVREKNRVRQVFIEYFGSTPPQESKPTKIKIKKQPK